MTVVKMADAQEIARDLVVVPNNDVQLVPNIGIIGGTDAVLVVETGMGPRNAQSVLDFAIEYAKGRRLYLTTTHFHPEHAFGAKTFEGAATYLVNRQQATDLQTKGAGYLTMFAGLGEAVAEQLQGVELPTPDHVYDTEYDLDLGGRVVQLRATGRGHSLGDQVIRVEDILFTGDLVETGQFAIFPWFPPHDVDVSGTRWLAVVRRLDATHPRMVIPGHGARGDHRLLTDVGDYLELLRDETWRRRDADMSEQTIVEEVTAVMVERRPDWAGREWLAPGVGCLCAERQESASAAGRSA